MGFNVQHSPSAAALGSVSRQAGLGNYSRFMQQMIEQKNSRAQQERMQKRQLGQQQKQFESSQQFQQGRDKDYQQFQEDMKMLGFGLQRQGKIDTAKINVAMGEVSNAVKQKQAQQEFLRSGWTDYVGKIKNFDDWNPSQKQRFKDLQEDMQGMVGSKAFTDEEKATVMQMAIQEMQAIQSTVIPRKRTQEDELAEMGIEKGKPWRDPQTGAIMTLTDKGLNKLSEGWSAKMEIDAYEVARKNLMTYDKDGNEIQGSATAIREEAYRIKRDFINNNMGMPGGAQQTPQGAPPPPNNLEDMVANPETRREVYYQLENVVQNTGLTQEQLDAMTDQEVINLIRIEEKMKREGGAMSKAPRRF